MSSVTRSILIVEDDPFISLDLKGALTSDGYKVVGPVTSSDDALESFDQHRPDLLLLDINIEGELDGIQVAAEVQKVASIPIVFLSGLNDEETLRRAGLVGPFGYLLKPFDEDELRATIAAAFKQYSPHGVTAAPGPVTRETAVRDEGESVESTTLHGIPFFDSLSRDEREAIEAFGDTIMVDGGSVLQSEDEVASTAYVVLSGRISVKKSTAAGKELILALLGPGDCFGLLPLLPAFNLQASARAQLDSKVLRFQRADFGRIISAVPALTSLLVGEALHRLNIGYDLSMSLAHSKVETRIVGTLSTLFDTIGKGVGKENGQARIFITRKELADLTGTTPETAIRVTKQLERDGILDLTRPGVIKIPNIRTLRDLLDD